MRTLPSIRSQRLLVPVALLAFLCSSCGNGENHKPVFPVEGKLLCSDGQFPAGAHIYLHPVDTSSPEVPRPSGTVGADGSFKLTTYTPNDGAPAGKYSVTVVWLGKAKMNDDTEPLLPYRYQDPTTSQLTAEVQEGPTTLSLTVNKR